MANAKVMHARARKKEAAETFKRFGPDTGASSMKPIAELLRKGGYPALADFLTDGKV
jgi:hypothetical protein